MLQERARPPRGKSSARTGRPVAGLGRVRRVLVLGVATVGALVVLARIAAAEKHPVYVGAKVCARCHRGPGMGYQHSRWLLSAHARAYASLAKPEAKRIARLSGIPEDPQKSPVCLGCHATAAEAEDWEKDETFAMEDGVQCEKCHGPGSEYIDEDVMMDREAAERAGLLMPTTRDCLA